MVERQIRARGIRSPRVLQAMLRVPRESFVPPHLVMHAYDDTPLPIGEGQTVSQPYIVARMLEALDLADDDRVLEIGTGSGYSAALLARLAAEVYTIERSAPLARTAAERLARLGGAHVHVVHADGTLGWPAAAPFDGIVVTAGGPQVPDSLRRQLAPGGRLVMPVGGSQVVQTLLRITRTGAGFREEQLDRVCFVPLIGAEGWRE